MRRVDFLPVILSCCLVMANARAQCPRDIADHLNWCSGDHGFNEGAVCGLSALSTARVAGLPAMTSEAVLGSTWDRTNMMHMTLVAFRHGAQNQAVAAAACCQLHNPRAHACFASHPDMVRDWLRSH